MLETQGVAGQITLLKGDWVAMVRERFEDLGRRKAERELANLPARLTHADGSTEGLLTNLAAKDAFFIT